MEIIKFNLKGDWRDLDDYIIERAVSVIKKGGSIVYPTDTVYGLGVDALRIESIRRLFRIKRRPETKPIPVMVRDIIMAHQLAFIDKEKEKILKAVWPGAITVVLEKREIVPSLLTAGKKTIGLRISDHPFTRFLMNKLEIPLTATSANFSGEPSLTSSLEVIKTFEKVYPQPDLILDAGDLPVNQPSTVLDLSGSHPRILRIGPVSKRELEKILG